MRIDCPSCHAAYQVPPERLASARAVKCARCGETWTAVPVEAPAAIDPPPAAGPLPEPAIREEPQRETTELEPPASTDRPMLGDRLWGDALPDQVGPQISLQSSPTRRISIPLMAAWVLSLVVLIAIGWTAIDHRAAIMAAWPPSTRAYAAVGLAPR